MSFDNNNKKDNEGVTLENNDGFGALSLFSDAGVGGGLTFISSRKEELPYIIMPDELSSYSAKFGYPLTDFEAKDIAESISETAEFYDLFVSPAMIEDSIRMCSILRTDTALYKGGDVDYSMIEQYSILQARVHEVIDLYAPLLDDDLKVFLGFKSCDDFDDEYNDMLLNIITDMLESNEGYYKEHSPYEAAYLFFTALNLKYKNDIEEYFEYRERKIKVGHTLTDVADRVFDMYSNMCGGVIDQ